MTKQQVLACIYPLIKDSPDLTVTPRLFAIACECSEEEISPIFQQLISEGFIKKKYMFLQVYKMTLDGLRQAADAHGKQQMTE